MAGGRQYERIPVPFWNLEISRGKTTFPSNIMTTMSSENVNQLQKRGPLLNLQIYNVYNFSLRSAQVTSMQWWFRIFWYRLISHFLHPPQFKKRSLFLPWIRNSSPCPLISCPGFGLKVLFIVPEILLRFIVLFHSSLFPHLSPLYSTQVYYLVAWVLWERVWQAFSTNCTAATTATNSQCRESSVFHEMLLVHSRSCMVLLNLRDSSSWTLMQSLTAWLILFDAVTTCTKEMLKKK